MEQNDLDGPGGGERRTAKNTVPDSYLGGADAVEKSSYVGDVHGADVGAEQTRNAPVTAAVSGGNGLGALGWMTLVLALLMLAAYGVGLLR